MIGTGVIANEMAQGTAKNGQKNSTVSPTAHRKKPLPSPTGSDEQATMLLQNDLGQMATVALSMHSKQPKRTMISLEKGYIEIMEYPRADKASIVDAAAGDRREICAVKRQMPSIMKWRIWKIAILSGNDSIMRLAQTKDVMDIMTKVRKDWNLKYPGEVW